MRVLAVTSNASLVVALGSMMREWEVITVRDVERAMAEGSGSSVALIDLGATDAGMEMADRLYSSGVTIPCVVLGDKLVDDTRASVLVRPFSLEELGTAVREAATRPARAAAAEPVEAEPKTPPPAEPRRAPPRMETPIVGNGGPGLARRAEPQPRFEPEPPFEPDPEPAPRLGLKVVREESQPDVEPVVGYVDEAAVVAPETEPYIEAEPYVETEAYIEPEPYIEAEPYIEPEPYVEPQPSVEPEPELAWETTAEPIATPEWASPAEPEPADSGGVRSVWHEPLPADRPAAEPPGRWKLRRRAARAERPAPAAEAPLVRRLKIAAAHARELEDLIAQLPFLADLRAMAEGLIEEIDRQFVCGVASVSVRGESGYEVVGHRGLSRVEAGMVIPETQSLFSDILKTREGILIQPVDLAQGLVSGIGGARTEAMMVAPALVDDECVAMVVVGGDQFTEGDLDRLSDLAAEAAPGLAVAQLLNRLRDYTPF